MGTRTYFIESAVVVSVVGRWGLVAVCIHERLKYAHNKLPESITKMNEGNVGFQLCLDAIFNVISSGKIIPALYMPGCVCANLELRTLWGKDCCIPFTSIQTGVWASIAPIFLHPYRYHKTVDVDGPFSGVI